MGRRHLIRLRTFAATIAVAATPTLAQTPAADFRDRIDPADERRLQVNPAPREAPPSVAPEIAAESAPAITISRIAFEGVAVPVNVADAARPFVGRMASAEVLQALVAAMSAAYEQSKIALFTVVVPEQDFAGGVVRVLIAEGHIEGVVLTGETEGRDHKLVKAYAEKLIGGEATPRSSLERYLSLITDIPGLKSKASLQSAPRRGAVKLALDLDYLRPTVTAGFSNRTSRFVKYGQFTGKAKAYRLLRDGDETQLNLAAAVNFKDSLYAGLRHSTPLLREGARLDIAAAVLKSRPADTGVTGDAQIYDLGISAPIIRSYKTNLSVRASLDALNSDNAVFGAVIAQERTRAARLSAYFSRIGETRSVSLRAGVAQGLNVLGARVTAPLGETDYTKFTANASAAQKLTEWLYLRLNAGGQWTDDALPANERFSVGGANFGRGFASSLINADRGYAVLAEAVVRPIKGGDFSKSEVYAFADYADVAILPRGVFAGQQYNLGSYGVGVRTALKDKGVIELEAARPYDLPFAGADNNWRFSVSWRVDFKP